MKWYCILVLYFITSLSMINILKDNKPMKYLRITIIIILLVPSIVYILTN